MKNKNTIIYWVSTGLFSVMNLIGALMYIIQHDMLIAAYTSLGYPTYLIYPLAAAKILGVATILIRKNGILTQLAYAGFFYLLLLGTAAHIMVQDGEFAPALISLVFLIISYSYSKTTS
ncbi:MAG: DoxX family protein [Candidatus Gracilibacteria bacterium]|nr:DoxX family protein [Candidatus Gracilibacteria bacterium]